jgi:sugar-specific transcriptional regulator TrmB
MKQLIISLGATDKEAETFLRLLELGPQTATIVAKHIGTPRSTMYVIMSALKEMGLIEEFERSGVKYFKTVAVQEISDVINAKKRKLDQTEELFKRLLPDLESKQKKLTMTPKVRFFEGKDQVMKMYEQVLREEAFCAMLKPCTGERSDARVFRQNPTDDQAREEGSERTPRPQSCCPGLPKELRIEATPNETLAKEGGIPI